MKKEILDTNVLVRLLVGDVPAQQQQASSWFKEAEQGARAITVLPIVIAECAYVLETFYKKRREEIADALEVFTSQRWLDISERDVMIYIWPRYRAGAHFVDCYLSAWAQARGTGLLTFDRKLQREYERNRE